MLRESNGNRMVDMLNKINSISILIKSDNIESLNQDIKESYAIVSESAPITCLLCKINAKHWLPSSRSI